MDMETTWFTIGLIGLAVGAIAFAGLGPTLAGDKLHHATIHFIIALVASIAYTAMLMGQGMLSNEDGHPFYYARYIDWAITTPLLLLGLALVATHGRSKDQLTLIGGLIAADIMMIVTGFFAAIASDWEKYVWYAISSGAFLAVLWLLWAPVRAQADLQDPDRAARYKRLAGYLTALWFAYPVVWLFGSQSFESLSVGTETMLYAILDILAKTGFGLALVFGVRSLEGRESEPRPRTVSEHVRVPA